MTKDDLKETLFGERGCFRPITDLTNYRWTGKKLFVPGSYNHPTETRCIQNAGKYKVFSYRRWGGNGFGYDSTRYLVDTETGTIWKVHESFYSFSQIVDKLKQFVGEW